MKISSIYLCIFFVALPGIPRSCNPEPTPTYQLTESPCPAKDVVHYPEDYPKLCGDSPTAVHCVTTIPNYPSGAFLTTREALIEIPEGMENFTGLIEEGDSRVWILKEIDQGMVRMRWSPDYYGVPIVKPFAHLRSDREEPEAGSSRMSLYLCVSDIRGECIVDSVMVWSWTMLEYKHISGEIFADDYEVAAQVYELRGNCPEYIKIGDTWKGWGELYRPEG